MGSQEELFDRERQFFSAVAETQPLTIILEDIHWADQATLEALRYLPRTLRGSATLIIATYRDDEITRRHQLFQLLPAITRESAATQVRVPRLDAAFISDIIQDRYNISDEDAERLTRHVEDRSEGNPFFVQELLASLEADGIIRTSDREIEIGNLEDVAIAPLIQQVIETRLARFDDQDQRLLEIASVIGQDVNFELWLDVSHSDEEDLLNTIDQSISVNLLEESSQRGHFRFKHALIRETLYERQIWPRRREWHRRVAEILDGKPHADPDEVADHYQEADDDRAIDWLIKAGDRAGSSYALAEAGDRYAAAIRLLERIPDTKHRRAILLSHVASLYVLRDRDRARMFIDEAIKLASELDRDDLLIEFRFRRGAIQAWGGEFRAGIEAMRTAQREFDQKDLSLSPGPSQSTGQFGLFSALLNAGYLDEAVVYGEKVGDLNPMLNVLWTLCRGQIAALRGRPDLAAEVFERAGKIATQMRYPIGVVGALTAEIYHLALPYRFDDLDRRAFLKAEYAKPRRAAIMNLNNAPARFPDLFDHGLSPAEGNWNVLRSRYVAGSNFRNAWWAQTNQSMLAEIARGQGDYSEAWQLVRSVLPDGASTEPGDSQFYAATRLQYIAIELSLDESDLATARAWLEARGQWLTWNGVTLGLAEGELGWARYHRVAGNVDRARVHAERAHGHASDPRQPLALIAAGRFLGQLDVDEEKHDSAEVRLKASLDLAERCKAPFEQALTLVVMAERAVKLDEVDEARRLIAQVRNICEPLGAKPTLERVDEIEASLPRTRRSDEDHPFGLTGREVEVLRLVARGRTDAEAAEELFISPRTVSQHLRNAYNKLGVNNRAEATRVAVEHGLT